MNKLISVFFFKPLFKKKSHKVRESVKFAVKADVSTIEFYTVLYIGVFFTVNKLVKRWSAVIIAFTSTGIRESLSRTKEIHFYCTFFISEKVKVIA